ncbi:Fatty alcohol oxidase [Klebsormidium nitens]|uniref:Long-chain-alcohol oxidase n=1 Tax=Klebsormidium nitens TaxID=105231 RepID=A0A1Y1HU14_KLENI|nr:Fatty alcohol oxidase [Klebsormidium nitens]|eukprot:GAQ81623.1 Fatty alcohol oxidase [Klebsormidium nitens]
MASRKLHPLDGGAPPPLLNERQIGVLASICETLIPTVDDAGSPSLGGKDKTGNVSTAGANRSPAKVHHPVGDHKPALNGHEPQAAPSELPKFFALSGSADGTPEAVAGLLTYLNPTAVGRLSIILTLLSWGLGTLLLAGRWALDWRFPFVHSFPALSPHARERILQGWASSRLEDFRALFRAFKSLTMVAFYGKVDESGGNPAWSAIGYVGPDPQRAKRMAARGSEAARRPLEDAVLDLRGDTGEDVVQTLRSRGFEASQAAASSDITVQCDVVVVGSGSGGGVVAGRLAQGGHKVLVLEKGHYLARNDLPLTELPTLEAMYEKGGLFGTVDGGVALLAGSTVGGGSAINWAASFKTQPHVTREWSQDLGLTKYGGAEYEEAMEAVCVRGGVQAEHVVHNLQNEVLRRGCAALGYDCGVVPRNVEDAHECGWCHMGCASGGKKATTETWLVDAVRAGALILAGVHADRILVEPNPDPLSARQHRARGVVATTGGGRRLVVEARVTVAAAGSLHTPPLLLRSGLENSNIGQHLHVHPVSLVWGYFPEGEGPPGRMYEGGIMTAFSRHVAQWNTTGYGALLMTASAHPAIFAANCPWTSGADMKARMTRYARTVVLIGITRDRGRVSASRRGHPVVQYWPGEADRGVLLTSAEHNLRVLAAAGAHEVGSFHAAGPRFCPAVPGEVDPRFETWLAGLRKRGVHKHDAPLASAHQMGSCRMGVHARSSVVDADCASWEVAGLFLGDASVLPTASGTNPMITVQSIAYCTSDAIKRHLEEQVRVA